MSMKATHQTENVAYRFLFAGLNAAVMFVLHIRYAYYEHLSC